MQPFQRKLDRSWAHLLKNGVTREEQREALVPLLANMSLSGVIHRQTVSYIRFCDRPSFLHRQITEKILCQIVIVRFNAELTNEIAHNEWKVQLPSL